MSERIQRIEEVVTKETIYVGKAWKDEIKFTDKVTGEEKSFEVINISLDSNIQSLLLDKNVRIQLKPNLKRESINPRTNQPYKDADYRLSIYE